MDDDTINQGAIALDLHALAGTADDAALNGLHWPTPYGTYDILSTDMVDAVVTAGRASATTEEHQAAMESKLYDMVTDLGLIARLAIDLANVRQADLAPLYDRDHSGWLRFLDEGETDSHRALGVRAWNFRKPPGTASELKRRIRRWRAEILTRMMPTAGRFDVLSRNTLLNEYFGQHSPRQIDMSPNYRDWPLSGTTSTGDMTSTIVGGFTNVLHPLLQGEGKLLASAAVLATAVVNHHLAQALCDLSLVRRFVSGRRAGAVLAGGTPKYIGRLIAWQYQQLGRSISRFAHGGERAFYDDYPWSLAELPACDRYFCHGKGEAAHIRKRLADGRTIPTSTGSIEFLSHGSRKHQNLRAEAQRQARKPPRSGTVMYVAGGYLGERLGDFPSRKPPDVIYFEWQRWLLNALRSAGFRVLVKPHPKGVLREAELLQPLCDEIVQGNFDPNGHAVDCYLFDFAGAAFFDALASNRGIVLTDMGVRPRDPCSFDDLRLRCQVVRCIPTERNLFRVDTNTLVEAVENAATSETWPESFFQTYFHG
jgi:hypothetical protein